MEKLLRVIAPIVFFFACSKHDSVTPPVTPPVTTPSLVTLSAFSPLSAPADSVVTITGANFSPDITKDTVKFNDTVAIVKYATDSQLIVVVPAGGSNGRITVTVGNQTAISAGTFIVSDQWTLLSAYPGTFMANTASFAVGTKLYIGLGEGNGANGPGTWFKEFWQYDAIANVWTRKADYPGIPSGAGVGFTIGGNGYVVNNLDSSGNNTLWQYDTASNTWTEKAIFPGGPQMGIVAFGVNNYGYAGLGTLAGYTNNTIWQYDPVADSWTQKGNFPGRATTYTTSFVIGNYAYVGTGNIGVNTDSGSAEFFQYDPAGDTWTQKGNFPGGARTSASGFAIGNNGYLGIGYNINGNYLSDFWQYNPSSDTWIQKKNFGGGGRGQAAGFSGSSQGYLGFGEGLAHAFEPNEYSSTYVDLWEYQP